MNVVGLSEVQFFAAVALAGDYNKNGAVDAADYTVWRSSFGSTSNLDADGNNNGVIDAADYVVWKNNALPLPLRPRRFLNRELCCCACCSLSCLAWACYVASDCDSSSTVSISYRIPPGVRSNCACRHRPLVRAGLGVATTAESRSFGLGELGRLAEARHRGSLPSATCGLGQHGDNARPHCTHVQVRFVLTPLFSDHANWRGQSLRRTRSDPT